jgi:hypothetical protein
MAQGKWLINAGQSSSQCLSRASAAEILGGWMDRWVLAESEP